jgi:hypothetical protein
MFVIYVKYSKSPLDNVWNYSDIYFDDRQDLKKLRNMEAKEQYWTNISKKFAAFENWDKNVNINRAWGYIIKNIEMLVKDSLC